MARYILFVYPHKPSPYPPLAFRFCYLGLILGLVEELCLDNVHWAIYDGFDDRLVARSALV